MDKIDTLLEKGNYELVLKITKNSDDIKYLFYRLAAFVALEKYEDALALINNKKSIMEQDLPLLIKTHIDILCALERFDEAYDVAKDYAELPYHSQEVEEILKELPHRIRNEEKKVLGKKKLSEEEMRKILLNEQNDERLLGILQKIDRIETYLPELENLLVTYPHLSIRVFILLTLVKAKINGLIKFKNSRGEIQEVRPQVLHEPFSSAIDREISSRINKYDDPTVASVARQIFSSYVLFIYPGDVATNINTFYQALILLSKKYLAIDFNSAEQELVNNPVISECISSLEKALKNI